MFHRESGGPLIGFGVRGAFAWDLAGEDPDAAVWATPRFDVPSLALRSATVGEIVLAAQRTITGSTPDVVEFDLAVQAGTRGDREQAEHHWRACLACGEMTAHYGLGYTLIELGRPREAFGHLAMYTEICPRNAWAWAFRGRAAHHMGETAEARLAYQAALGYEAAGSTETNAAIWLAELDAETADNTGADRDDDPSPAARDRDRALHRGARVRPRPPRRPAAQGHHDPVPRPPARGQRDRARARRQRDGGDRRAASRRRRGRRRRARARGDRPSGSGPRSPRSSPAAATRRAKHKEDWTLRKHRYLAHLEVAEPDVLLVSGADKLHNARSILSDLREHGDGLWERFNRGAREQLWYYGALRDAFLRRLPGRLADELDRTVREIERRIDPQDRVAWLGLPCEFWSTMGGESGAFIDWPGCPLVVEDTEAGPQVRADVGSRRLSSTRRATSRPRSRSSSTGCGSNTGSRHERAWLISDDHGNLRDACRRVAALAPLVTEQAARSRRHSTRP